MSSTQIDMPARVAMVKPACISLSAKITVSRSPQRRKDALMSLEISFFLSALLINSKGRPTGRISESRARPTVVRWRTSLSIFSPPGPNSASRMRTVTPACSSALPESYARATSVTSANTMASPGGFPMTNPEQAAVAALLLRLALGVMFLAHAWVKVKVFTPSGTAQFFKSLGLPGELAYLTIAAEIVGGVLLILGVETRWVALALVPLMLGTIVLVHGKAGWQFTNKDGGWEYPAFWVVGLLALALLGDGAAALGPMLGLS